MSLLHRATLHPTKLQLVAGWVPQQPWASSNGEPAEMVAAYRFDDPDGAVGLETLLLRTSGDELVQVPLTYRDAPLPDVENGLIGTTEHSVLGTRWVYDATVDLVHIAALDSLMRTGGGGAELFDESGQPIVRDTQADVRGTGPLEPEVRVAADKQVHAAGATVSMTATGLRLVTYRYPLAVAPPESVQAALRGTWRGQSEPVTLAVLV